MSIRNVSKKRIKTYLEQEFSCHFGCQLRLSSVSFCLHVMAGVELWIWYCLACQVTSFRWCRSKKGTLENHGMSENVKLPIPLSVSCSEGHSRINFGCRHRWLSLLGPKALAKCFLHDLSHAFVACNDVYPPWLSEFKVLLGALKAVIWWECACLELWNAHLCVVCFCFCSHVLYVHLFIYQSTPVPSLIVISSTLWVFEVVQLSRAPNGTDCTAKSPTKLSMKYSRWSSKQSGQSIGARQLDHFTHWLSFLRVLSTSLAVDSKRQFPCLATDLRHGCRIHRCKFSCSRSFLSVR